MMDWENIPEPILFMIFSRLEIKDLLSSGAVCVRWYHAQKDNLLWKHVFTREFQTTKRLCSVEDLKNVNYKQQLISLKMKYPCVESQVLHGEFKCLEGFWISKDGSRVAVNTKNLEISIWKRTPNDGFENQTTIDIADFGWEDVKQAEFSPCCTKLMVSGSNEKTATDQIAIFSIGNFNHLHNFYNFSEYERNCLSGYWECTNHYVGLFMRQNLTLDHPVIISLWICSAPTYKCTETINRIYKNATKSVRLTCSDAGTCALRTANLQLGQNNDLLNDGCGGNSVIDQYPMYERDLLKLKNENCIAIQLISQRRDSTDTTSSIIDDQTPRIHPELCNTHLKHLETSQMLAIFIMGSSHVFWANKIGFQPITAEILTSSKLFDCPAKVIEFNMLNIRDIQISPMKDYLYASFRKMKQIPQRNDFIALQEKLSDFLKINLSTLAIEEEKKCHFWIHDNSASAASCHLDAYCNQFSTLKYVSTNYMVTSVGSNLMIWDKKFGMNLNEINIQSPLTRIIINPNDEEELFVLTQKKLQIFVSKQRARACSNPLTSNDEEIEQTESDDSNSSKYCTSWFG